MTASIVVVPIWTLFMFTVWYPSGWRQGRCIPTLHLHDDEPVDAIDLQPTRRRHPEIPDRRQPKDRARVVHSDHPDGPRQRRWRNWYRMDDQNPQLQPEGNCGGKSILYQTFSLRSSLYCTWYQCQIARKLIHCETLLQTFLFSCWSTGYGADNKHKSFKI